MTGPNSNPLTEAVHKALGCLALACLVVWLIVLTSCACRPHAEPCDEPFPTAAPRQ